MDCSLLGSSVHGVLQARILEWVAISFSRGIFPTQGLDLCLPHRRQILYYLSHQKSLSTHILTINREQQFSTFVGSKITQRVWDCWSPSSESPLTQSIWEHLGTYISNKLPGNVDAAELWTRL